MKYNKSPNTLHALSTAGRRNDDWKGNLPYYEEQTDGLSVNIVSRQRAAVRPFGGVEGNELGCRFVDIGVLRSGGGTIVQARKRGGGEVVELLRQIRRGTGGKQSGVDGI